MQVLLTRDVKKVGKKFDVVNVKDGYALNFLFPQMFAEKADKNTEARAEALRRKRSLADKNVHYEKIAKIFGDFDDVTITLRVRANEQGVLFAGIDKKDIAEKFKEKYTIEIPTEILVVKKPIKTIGEHVVEIIIGNDIKADLKVLVEQET